MTKLRQLQLKCLEILDFVIKICQEHHIYYSLCGGSVVGAHLYNGFLPWDDDIDIMITREHYMHIVFEGRTVMIVRDYIEYLQTRYNRTDFREAEEMQVPPHYKYVSFDLPYKEFILNNKSIKTKTKNWTMRPPLEV